MALATLSLCGAAGGVGTTRTSLECAALLAADGRDVAVLDAAYATQGLADHVPGRIEPDITALCTGDEPLAAGLIDLALDVDGRVAVCPARAPFERIARAKTPEAAQSFETRFTEAAAVFDHVLVDTPPVAANQAVAAATAADTVALVCDADRAIAALPRARDRLADVGVSAPATVVTHTASHGEADATVPTLTGDPPVCLDDSTVARAIRDVLRVTLDVDVDTGDISQRGIRGYLPV